MRRAVFLFLWTIAAFAQGSSNLVISQVYGGGGNAAAPLRNDFIEIFNRGDAPVSIAGWSVQYASATGSDWQVTTLGGVIAPGRYYLIQQAAGANTDAPALPDPEAAGTIAMSATAAKVALVRSTTPLSGASPSGDIVDFVGYGPTNASETTPTPALSNTTAAVRRGNGCSDTNHNAADFQIGIPRPRNSTQGPIDCNPAGPVAEPMRISEIQGPGDESPAVGRLVVTRGLVTGRKTNGFFMQSQAQDIDSDPATSEGLFVFTQAAPPASAIVGNLLEVTGAVAEFRPASDPASPTLTELIEQAITVLAANQELPEPVPLSRVANLEWLEGMRVTAPALRVVGPSGGAANEANATATSNGVFYAVEPGGLPPFASPSGPVGARLLRIDSRALGRQPLDVRTGDSIDRATGPLDFGFRAYTIDPDTNLLALSGSLQSTLLPRTETQYAIASMNLQRLFDDRDDPNTSDAVLTAPAFQTRVAKIGRVIREVLQSPEIIGVSEVENLVVLQEVGRAAGGYEAYLAEGNDIGGIDVGVLVRRDRVSVDSFTQEGKDTKLDEGVLNDRPPILLRARVAGVPVVIVVNHSRSLINADTAPVARKRRLQAEFLSAILRRESQENLVSIGDYNMPAHDELMQTLKAPGLVNLSDTLRPDEAYTYIQDGVKQALDHVLLSTSAHQRLSRYQIAHINADFPETSRNSETGIHRISDHDVPIAYFDQTPTSVRPVSVTNAASMLNGSIAPGEWLTLFVPGPLEFVKFGETMGTIVTSSPDQTTVIAPIRGFIPEILAGTRFFTMNPIALPTSASAPGIFMLPSILRRQGAILNQDSSVNDASNPAIRGAIVSIYATGLSTAAPGVWMGSARAEVLFSGPAPELLPGIWQVNARIPQDAPTGPDVPVFVSAGDQVSATNVVMSIR